MSLRDLRTERQLPMDALALLAGVDISTISRIEAGKQRPSPGTVVKLAKALGISARRMQTICDTAPTPESSGGVPA